MNSTLKTRDYLFDNYKALLIFLVVIGHFTGPSTKDNTFLMVLKWMIVSFHMPAFIFISGYFSKKELPLGTLIRRLAVPYVIYEIIYYLLYTVILHKSTELALLKPKFTLWYLLALFLWRLITPYVKKIPHYMTFAVIAGFLIGFSNMENNLLTIPRALVYYPFYLAGTLFQREWLTKHRTSANRRNALLSIGIIFLFLTWISLHKMAPIQVFYGRYNFLSMKQSALTGLLWRCLLYIIGFIMTFALMILIPEKQLPVSYIGTRTMAIYLFHGLTYKCLEDSILIGLNTPWETCLLLLGCAGLTLLLSYRPFSAFTGFIANIPFPKIRKCPKS